MIQYEHARQQKHRTDNREQSEPVRRHGAPLHAPQRNQQKQRNDGGFERGVKQKQIAGAHGGQQKRFGNQRQKHVFAHHGFDVLAADKHGQQGQKRNQHHKKQRQSVHADAHADFKGRHIDEHG